MYLELTSSPTSMRNAQCCLLHLHARLSQLQDALNEMACIADEINQRKKEHELLQDIQANLTGWSVSGFLIKRTRILLSIHVFVEFTVR